MEAIRSPEVHNATDDQQGLVVYVTTQCPFCMRVKALFEDLGVEPKYINSADPDLHEQYMAAVKRYEHYTVPMVLYNGQLVGGCDDTCALLERGDLARMINLPSYNAAPKPGTERRELISPGLFNYPAVVDSHAVRAGGLVVMVLAILFIVFRSHPWVWWVCFGLSVDFGIRLMFGGGASPIGSVGLLLTCWMEEELIPGVPKQFAIMVGFFFTGFATILYHAGSNGYTTYIGGSILMGILAFFAFLEAFFDFCAGCYVFGYLVKFGIVKTSIYQPYTDSYEYTNYALRSMNAKVGWVDESDTVVAEENSAPAGDKNALGWRRRFIDERNRPLPAGLARPQRVMQLLAPNEQVSAVTIRYHFPKYEDTYREKWSWKYITFPDFGACLGTSGIAMMIKFATMVFKVPSAAWKFCAFFAAIHFGLMFLCLLLKCILHPKKIFMDLQNPMKRNASTVVPLVFVVFSGLTFDIDHNLSLVMFWFGCPATVFCTMITVAYYIRNRQSGGSYNPSVLIGPLGMFVCGMVIPFFAADMNPHRQLSYMEASKFMFGAALLMELVFLAGTIYHGVFFHWGPDMFRPSVAIWMGASFITVVSWVAITKPAQWDMFAFVFFSGGILLYLAIVYLIWPGNWLLRGRFVMTNWFLSFPLSVFGVASIMYYQSQGHSFALGCCWVSFISSGLATFTCLMHNFRNLFQRKWPAPMPECSPLMFNKVLHDGLREYQARLRAECKHTPSEAEKENSTKRFLDAVNDYLHLLRVHTEYEISFLLPEFKMVSKAQVAVAEEQHKYTLEEIAKLQAIVDAKDVVALRDALPEHLATQYDFFQWEEDHLAPLMHKGMNGRIAVLILERIWETVAPQDLERLVVMTVRYVPKQMQRVMFIKAITSALPERCQQLGRWLYVNMTQDALGDVKLALLFDDVPDIIPRGLGITWTRQI
eukprot:CAMPEP_0176411570 /NCGR_PEP_ID=MMETSP0127-20121128/3675_1 /TAXON_ID=938130 /ORGANISM="Platyophrya macrostoma, Strain WH" /LENGTH=932 /DNA_ID=CAMNT_0017791171 /DNA_START=102 /DNA_END=2900 /DNA_ORIENTATION=-